MSEGVARFVRFGSVLYGSVAHTLRTPNCSFDSVCLHVPPLQHVLQLISRGVTRFVPTRSLLYGSVPHTFRTPTDLRFQTSPTQLLTGQQCSALSLTQSRSEGTTVLD